MPVSRSWRVRTPAEAAADPLRLLDRDDELPELVDALLAAPAYAVDTEFHRERTYFPQPALLQIAWDGGLVLVDPLAVDLTPLAEVLEGPGLAVMHAAGQDMEVLDRACGAAPTRLFDTQVAAGFLGFSSPALVTLVARVLGLTLPKADRLTDWLRRPLRPEQLTYAASDVAHLLELHALIAAELDGLGRLSWAEEECELLRRRGLERPAPEEAWLKLKDLRHVRGRGRGVAQEVAAWRERRAAATDQPVRHVLPDLAIVGIATRPPTTVQELRAIRGLDDRHLRGGAAEGLLEAVERGLSLPEPALRTARRDDLERTNRPAVALAGAWLAQLGRDVRIDPTLLATRADLAALVAGDPDARLLHGWRGEVLGAPLRQLLAGDAALAFEGDGRLVLEERSGRVLTIDLPVPEVGWA